MTDRDGYDEDHDLHARDELAERVRLGTLTPWDISNGYGPGGWMREPGMRQDCETAALEGEPAEAAHGFCMREPSAENRHEVAGVLRKLAGETGFDDAFRALQAAEWAILNAVDGWERDRPGETETLANLVDALREARAKMRESK